ncbi:MAG: DUF3298 and DUF4163 domain-containing protein [Bacteroidales bacterium]|nr:DUF3298 and DUF4163 domain-containing protein [Bacteroidales bacterium]
MKKTYLAALSLSAIVAACTGAHNKANDTDNQFETENLKYEHVAVASYGTECIAKIEVDYPVDNGSVLGDSVREWIVSEISPYKTWLAEIMASNPSVTVKNGRSIIDAVGMHLLDSAVIEIDDMQTYFDNQMPGYEYNYKFIRGYEDDSVLTYNGLTYMYTGGAHGISANDNTSFDKASGAKMTWDNMFTAGYEAKLLPLIRRGLMTQYFEVETERQLAEMLLVNVSQLPLPSSDPYYEADGLRFTYQEYEIAPYSAGMPSCVIPYADLAGILH